LTIPDINKRLNERYKILSGGDRTVQARQRTLRALVDWSYDLLDDNEQTMLARICVFAGSFGIEAAEAVCGADPLARDDVLDLLTSLVEKSLVNMEEGTKGTRFRLLETIREYAREKLVGRNEHQIIAAAHCDHFLKFAKASNLGLQGPDQAEWTRRVESDLDDLRAAITLALDGGVDPIIAVKFEVALMGFWMLRGYSTEGRKYVRAALALPAVLRSDVANAHALYVGAGLADGQGNHLEALKMLEKCLALRRTLGNPIEIAAALSTLSLVRLHEGNADQSRHDEQEAVEIFRTIGNRTGEAIGLLHLGHIDVHVANNEQARRHFEGCLAIARDIMHFEMESECELMLGELSLDAGDLQAARKRFTRSLEVCRNAENKRDEATALWRLGKADLVAGEIAAAGAKLANALRAFQAFEMYAEMLGCLEDHALLRQMHDGADEAVRVYASAASARERLMLSRTPRNERNWRDGTDSARKVLGGVAYDAAWSEGRGWEIDRAIACALLPVEIQKEPA
jgi:tetratricopeptide (TPR) repeat protein